MTNSNQDATWTIPPPGKLLGTFEVDGVAYSFCESNDTRGPVGGVEVFAGDVCPRNYVVNFGLLFRAMLKELERVKYE